MIALRSPDFAARAVGPLRVQLLAGRIETPAASVLLAPSERVLAFALARSRRGAARQRLEELIWPDFQPDQAQNLFNVTLCRLRKRVGLRTIVQDGRGYRYGDDVSVDLWELERGAAGDPVPGNAVSTWIDEYEAIDGTRGEPGDADWLHVMEGRLLTAARARADRLSLASLAQRRPDLALRLAQATLAGDPCDEPACAVAMRAHLALGDRSAAIRAYRDYERALLVDLELTPSPELLAVLTPLQIVHFVRSGPARAERYSSAQSASA